jgi:tetratricopeptide (TPR) repeat protein
MSTCSPVSSARLFETQPASARAFLSTLLLIVVMGSTGCQKPARDESERINDQLRERTLNSEPLRQGLRNLSQTTAVNKKELTDETRVLINAWLKVAEKSKPTFTPSKLLDVFDQNDLQAVGCSSATSASLSAADMECLFEDRMMRKLSEWIVAAPVRDRVFQPMLTRKMSQLTPEAAEKLERAYKLFDWTIRNIKLANSESSLASVRTRDARLPLSDSGVGFTNLPWEVATFCMGDFVSRGRVFGALATQQGIDTCWISLGSAPGAAGDLFAMGVLVADQILLFEPKLGLPILDPDTDDWATIQDVAKNEKILRRFNLPQYEYAIQQPLVKSVQLLIDATPFALSQRAKLLEGALLGDERMIVAVDGDGMAERLGKAAPNASVSLWQMPLIAQLYANRIQERLGEVTQFTMRYMAEHMVWLWDCSISNGRQLHLAGKFDVGDEDGALKTYTLTRVDDVSLRKMAYNPDVQQALGLTRETNESEQQFEARLLQAIVVFSRAKFDASFLLGQLHFDRGDYKSSSYMLRERLVGDQRAIRWHAPGWYTLARAYTEMELYAEAEEALLKPSIETGQQSYAVNPQDAGNRIRLRYLKRLTTKQE